MKSMAEGKTETISDILRCRICGDNDFAFVREVQSLRSSELCRFYVCNSCGTIVYAGGSAPDYALEDGQSNIISTPYIKYYIEVGAGVFSFASQMQLLRRVWEERASPKDFRFLDVGAGFGFAVDMARFLGWDAIGVEPSGMGRVGAQTLGVRMIVEYLEDANLPDGSFDAILASEVIEHVPEPEIFLKTLSRYLKPDGILFLTTPNADAVREAERPEKEWHEVFSPGYHLNILSLRALDLLLTRNGYNDVRIFLSGGSSGRKQMVALGAHEKGALLDDLEWTQIERERSDLVLSYLRHLVSEKESKEENDAVYRGALFRLVDLLANNGNYQAAQPYAEKIGESLRSEGIDETRLAEIQVSTFEEYVTKLPAYAGLYYFYKGILSLNYQKHYEQAIHEFRIAAHLCDIEQKVGYFTRIGWYERAKLHEGLALLYAGRQREALQIFDALLAQPDKIPPDALDTFYWNKAIAHLQVRENINALRYFAEFVLKKQSYIPPAYHQPALHAMRAFGQIVEDLQSRIDSTEALLRRTMEAHIEDGRALRAGVENLACLAEKIVESFARLSSTFETLVSTLRLPLRVLAKPLRTIRRLTNPWGIMVSENGSEITTGELVAGRRIEQRIACSEDGFTRVCLKVGTFQRVNTSLFQIDILDEDRSQVRRVVEVASRFSDNQLHSFSFEPIPDSAGKRYWISISSPNAVSSSAVTLWCKHKGNHNMLTVDGKKRKNMLIYELGYARREAVMAREAKDILIITPDTLGEIRIGLGMRHWEIAKTLALRGLAVTLATPHPIPPDLKGEGFELRPMLTQAEVLDLAQVHRLVMVQGDVLQRYPVLEASDKRIIMDMVTPVHIEDMEKGREQFERSYDLIRKCLIRGNFFVCGNERQRIYWLGMLTALGRISKDVKDMDTQFRNLIDVAGFGITDKLPVKSRRALKGVVSGIQQGDFLMIWFGGLWDWLDPLTLIHAVHEAHKEDQRIKLFFSAYRRPNGDVPLMAERARQLCQELRALGRCVFFNDYPVAFEDRADYLLESDIGVICQAPNFETQISARTRILDYIWAGLPVLMNEGDELGEVVRRNDLGIVISGASVDEWKDAILKLALDPQGRAQKASNIMKIRCFYHWKHLVEPIFKYVTASR